MKSDVNGPPTAALPNDADALRLDIVRRLLLNQIFWMAGYSLTSGGFLTYFAYELGAHGFTMAIILALPETIGCVGVLTRMIVGSLGGAGRKGLYFGLNTAARLIALAIPLMAFGSAGFGPLTPLQVVILALAVSSAMQAIAYVCYLSWISDIVPEGFWGRFFGLRGVAEVLVLLVVPVTGGYLRDYWRHHVSDEAALLAYVVSFALGTSLQLFSMLPLIKLPCPNMSHRTSSLGNLAMAAAMFRNRSMRFLLIHSWTLAAANGLTQAAFFLYGRSVLNLSLGTYYLLITVMRLVMLPTSLLAGVWSDRVGNRSLLMWSAFGVTFAMPCWLAATPERWGLLFGAYAIWGLFAAVNLAGHNFCLKLSPRSDNTMSLAMFRDVAGLIAGLSGLLGGLWIDNLLSSLPEGASPRPAYQLVMAASWVGRLAAVAWLIPTRDPRVAQSHDEVPV